MNMNEQNFFMEKEEQLSRVNRAKKRTPRMKKRIISLLLFAIIISSVSIYYVYFVHQPATTLFATPKTSIELVEQSDTSLTLQIASSEKDYVYIGLSNVQLDGKPIELTNAHLSNPASTIIEQFIQEEAIEKHVAPEVLSSYYVQQALGIYALDQEQLHQSSGTTISVDYTAVEQAATLPLSFVLTIYTVDAETMPFNPDGFAAIDEQLQFVYLKQQQQIQVELK